MGLDGADRRPIVEDNLHWPNGIAVDQILDRVYWSDAHFDVLESIKIDGTDRRVILKDVDKHPFGLAVFEVWRSQKFNKFIPDLFVETIRTVIFEISLFFNHRVVSFLSSRPNWDLPTPSHPGECEYTLACLPHPRFPGRGEHTRLRERG
jgi:hypothetical protein